MNWTIVGACVGVWFLMFAGYVGGYAHGRMDSIVRLKRERHETSASYNG